jgi:hypothetical protein
LLLDLLASGTTTEQILEEYPQLTRDDILAAIAYGAEMSRGRFVDLLGHAATCQPEPPSNAVDPASRQHPI